MAVFTVGRGYSCGSLIVWHGESCFVSCHMGYRFPLADRIPGVVT